MLQAASGGGIGCHFKDYGHFYSSMNFDENSDLGNLFGQKWLKKRLET